MGKGHKLSRGAYIKKMKDLRSKLSREEDLLACTCDKGSSSLPRESTLTRPDVSGRLKRHRTHKQAEGKEEPEAAEIGPVELPEPATFVQERTFVYDRNLLPEHDPHPSICSGRRSSEACTTYAPCSVSSDCGLRYSECCACHPSTACYKEAGCIIFLAAGVTRYSCGLC